MASVFARIRCRLGRHDPVPDFSRWMNVRQGDGFYVSRCAHCGIPMLKRHFSDWQAVHFRAAERGAADAKRRPSSA
jgi:hypothetical protein